MAPGLSLKEIIGVEEKNFLRSYPERGSCQISPRRANASVEFRLGLTIRCVLLYYAAYYGGKQMSTTAICNGSSKAVRSSGIGLPTSISKKLRSGGGHAE